MLLYLQDPSARSLAPTQTSASSSRAKPISVFEVYLNNLNWTMVVLIFIVTAAASALIQVPGGWNNDGAPNAKNNPAFMAFVVFMLLAFIIGLIAVLFNASIAPWDEDAAYQQVFIVVLMLFASTSCLTAAMCCLVFMMMGLVWGLVVSGLLGTAFLFTSFWIWVWWSRGEGWGKRWAERGWLRIFKKLPPTHNGLSSDGEPTAPV